MAEKVGDLAYIIIDCIDNHRVAAFWGNVLGLEISDRSHPYIDLERPGTHSPVMSFQKVEEPKTEKNRQHLDIKVSNLSVATARIQELGGRLIKHCVEEPFEWCVMADPEENEFCIVTS